MRPRRKVHVSYALSRGEVEERKDGEDVARVQAGPFPRRLASRIGIPAGTRGRCSAANPQDCFSSLRLSS